MFINIRTTISYYFYFYTRHYQLIQLARQYNFCISQLHTFSKISFFLFGTFNKPHFTASSKIRTLIVTTVVAVESARPLSGEIEEATGGLVVPTVDSTIRYPKVLELSSFMPKAINSAGTGFYNS